MRGYESIEANAPGNHQLRAWLTITAIAIAPWLLSYAGMWFWTEVLQQSAFADLARDAEAHEFATWVERWWLCTIGAAIIGLVVWDVATKAWGRH